ncbi:hypothetical protein BSKO_00638 [Bryopsis sp. KO-2023]|nr:hypothetical protein BSKO_00638 [Bryopsis sp. KO-2023]
MLSKVNFKPAKQPLPNASRRFFVPRAAAEFNGSRNGSSHGHDVVALGNLCLDVVLPFDKLPGDEFADRDVVIDVNTKREIVESWLANPSDESAWEVGGATNFLLAGSRLGLRTASVGHVGDDVFGQFLLDVLKEEDVDFRRLALDDYGFNGDDYRHLLLGSTLICFVLVDPEHRHAFCSQYDIQPGPIFDENTLVPPETETALKETKCLFLNGYSFDECSPGYIIKTCETVKNAGGSIFFDPGPRCFPLLEGTRPGVEAFKEIVSMSDVLLMTKDEAQAVTGQNSAEKCADWVLDRPGGETKWCVVKDGKNGSLVQTKRQKAPVCASGYQVEVSDTVGCGDSFASAVCLGFLRGCDPQGVLALANAVGAGTATNKGAGRNVASRQKVLEILRQSSIRAGVESAMELIGGGQKLKL